MALAALPQMIEVIIDGHVTDTAGNRKRIVNVLHYGYYGAGVPAVDLATFLANFNTAVSSAWAAVKPTAYVCDAVSARTMIDTSAAAVFYGTPTNFTGSVAGDWQPPDSSAYLQKVSTYRGRRGMGGIHLSPVLEADTVGFQLGSTAYTTYGTLATALYNGISDGANTFQPVVWSRTTNPPPVIPGPYVPWGSQVLQIRVRKTLGSEDRRRVRGVY